MSVGDDGLYFDLVFALNSSSLSPVFSHGVILNWNLPSQVHEEFV